LKLKEAKMREYIGKYRVVAEFDKNTLEPIKDDLYIQCVKEGQIYRFDSTCLAYYRPTRGNSEQLSKKLIDLGVEGINNRSTDGDILIYFREESLDIVAKELGASTNGVNINPTSIKNLRKQDWFKKNIQFYIDNGLYEKPRELSEEEKEIYRERFKEYINK
jgi:mRNA-degrading endonuclease RelE of RelBE toxin-antitoxin system